MKWFQSLRPLALRSTIPLRIIRPSQLGLRSISRTTGEMTSKRDDSIPHELRTAAEPRQNRLHPVRLSHIEQVNPSVRLLQFALPPQENNVWVYFPFSSVASLYMSLSPVSFTSSPPATPGENNRRWIHMPRTANSSNHTWHLLSHTFTQETPLTHFIG